jgi:hypothetical protein
VTISEIQNPTVAPFIASPSTLAIVGAASGFQSASESITLNGVTPYTFRNTGINTTSVSVVDLASGATIDLGNYRVVQASNPDGVASSGDETYTIQRTSVPATAPTVAAGGAGVLTGTYVYAVAFVNPLGVTTIGPQSGQVSLSSQQASLTNIPIDASATNTATARNVYRAKVVNSVVGTFNLVGTIADNTTTIFSDNVSDATAATGAQPKIGIADGGQVIVSYQFTDVGYYQPQSFTDFPSLMAVYGAPYNTTTGAVSSPLSFAAMLAFQNGASEIVAVAAASASDSDVENAISQLVNADVPLVTVVSGSANVHSSLIAHVNSMNTQGQYRMGVIGRDGTTTTYQASDLQLAAKGINDESVVMVSPATFVITNPADSTKTYNIGSQYMAAAVAGMFAARDVQYPLTRKFVAGFSGIFDNRTPTQQVQDSQAGLLEIVQLGGSGGPLQVRHGVTTAVSSINTAEASVIRAKHEMARRLKNTLNQAIVGQVLRFDEVSVIIGSLVSSILEQLVHEQAIQAYINVTANTEPNNPTAVDVSFSYLPSFPVNNINVQFTIDTNTGDFSGVNI